MDEMAVQDRPRREEATVGECSQQEKIGTPLGGCCGNQDVSGFEGCHPDDDESSAEDECEGSLHGPHETHPPERLRRVGKKNPREVCTRDQRAKWDEVSRVVPSSAEKDIDDDRRRAGDEPEKY